MLMLLDLSIKDKIKEVFKNNLNGKSQHEFIFEYICLHCLWKRPKINGTLRAVSIPSTQILVSKNHFLLNETWALGKKRLSQGPGKKGEPGIS